MKTMHALAGVARDGDGFVVHVSFAYPGNSFDTEVPVDRKFTQSWSVKTEKLANRLASAINAQKITSNHKIATDCNGKTYVSFSTNVIGRTLNADLKRLGF